MSSLVIVVGLPGSGKTHYCQNYEETHAIFDDYLSSLFDGSLVKALKEGRKVCVTDPRLTRMDILKRQLKMFQSYIRKEDTLLVLFSHDAERCLENALRRGSLSKIKNDIDRMSPSYQELLASIDELSEYQIETISVY
jgi:hypothetical protein